ncbi:MAG: hypothetical protein Fur0037_04340 [Planctomycetota bacterium]
MDEATPHKIPRTEMRLKMRACAAVSAALFLLAVVPAQGTAVGFAEEFALSADRGKALELLVPGSAEYYYYACLWKQHEGAYGEVPGLLSAWIHRHGRSALVEEIENRQALLTFDRDPAACYEFLRRRLGVRFSAERRSPQARPSLPTRLDPSLLSRPALQERALSLHPGTTDGFTDLGLSKLSGMSWTDDQLMSYLSRLSRPDVPGLPALVERNLRDKRSRGFGSLPIHGSMLLEQLEELSRLKPDLLGNASFVNAYLSRLRPGAGVSWEQDAGARRAYLERLWSFASRLPSSQNSVKAHVLYRLLEDDLSRGEVDRERLLSYLRLPRQVGYIRPEYLRSRPRGEGMVEFGRSYPTGFPPIGSDEALVRACLERRFEAEEGYGAYAEYLEDGWLERLFAETKILSGQGEVERWYSLLSPGYVEELKKRVEIAFPATQRRFFGAEEPVGIDVDVKNVPKLLVKVFAIDTFDYEREQGRPVDASIDLDGLVANEEKTYAYDTNPLLRVRRHFEFPRLREPGTYVVEFLGNGISSRAVIRKGELRYGSRLGSAGHVIWVLDEKGDLLKDARVWIGGREYEPDEDGEVVIPFAAKGLEEPMILRRGRLTSLQRLRHESESYELAASVFVPRESLIAGEEANVLVRPTLLANGVPVSLSLLEGAKVRITARDQNGVESGRTYGGLSLDGRGELELPVAVPEGLARLEVRMTGKVKNLSLGKEEDLASEQVVFEANGIDSTDRTRTVLLGKDSEGWYLEIRGKNGEPVGDVAEHVTLKHEDYADAIEVDLKSDAKGRIGLGALPGIRSVTAASTGLGPWALKESQCRYDQVVTGLEGDVLRIPYEGTRGEPSREDLSLLEVAGGQFVRDAFGNLSIADGFVEMRGLRAGDYDLWSKIPDRRIAVKVEKGRASKGWISGRDRMLESSGEEPLWITGLEADGEDVVIRLSRGGEGVRVHAYASRYAEAYDAFGRLSAPVEDRGAERIFPRPESSYHAGRTIGDEYRYILDRRYAAKFPGNMLKRPGLILNPWELRPAVESDAWNKAVGMGGGAGGRYGGRGGAKRRAKAVELHDEAAPPGTFANVDFLAGRAVLASNLRPDGDGVVRVARGRLGPGSMVHVIAVDGRACCYRLLALPGADPKLRDLRLSSGLDPERHFTEQRRIEFLSSGQKTAIEDVTTTKLESYDTLAKAFSLLRTLSGEASLDEFAFLLRWPKLSAAEKRELYSAHACHEVHLFLHEKDRAFFDDVVRPYLSNKADKTFLDRWLLEEDLTAYLEPRAFARLNAVEKILLAKRLPGERESIARLLREALDLVPPDETKDNLLFAAALKGNALEVRKEALLDLLEDRRMGEPQREGGAADMSPRPKGPTTPGPAGRVTQAPPASKKAQERAAEKPEAPEEKEKAGADDFFREAAKDVRARGALRQLYRAPGRTLEYAESNYWRVPIESQGPDLVDVNGFWLDFAESKGGPFCSPRLGEATGNAAEVLLALSVLDLPFEAKEPKTERSLNRLSIEARTPILLVKKEVLPAETSQGESPILIGQGFFRVDDRYRFEGSQRFDKYVTDEFLTGVAYGCQVVVTNPTSTPRKLELLLQIPRGSMPVANGFRTKGFSASLGPFSTQSFEYSFYFPKAGDYAQYPAHVSKDGKLVAYAAAPTLHVVSTPSVVDTTSWEHVSQDGSERDVLLYLDSANVQRLDLSRIAWRMRDRAFFGKVTDALRARHVYSDVLWSYGLLHEDERTAREYLSHQDGFVSRCGPWLSSRLLSIDPMERGLYQRIEFEPLFHSREHRFGRERVILNADLARQYGTFLSILCHRPALGSEDWLDATYYLLLQDRVEEAMSSFSKVDAASIGTRLQYDYLRCYLDFFTAEHSAARGIAEKYREHPVTRWRNLFADVLNQLAEIEGKAAVSADERDRTQRQTELAGSEPGLDLSVESKKVRIGYRNLSRCEVSYYELDVEFSFSTNPFVQQGSGSFAYVEPNRRDVVSLPADQKEVEFDLPEQYQRSNVLVEVSAGGLVRRKTYLSNTLSVQMAEAYGQLVVRQSETDKALPKVYVKVYARLPGGEVRFHKDGYTDLRGRFDYASISESGTENAERFAILVLSENDGALIREVAPPGR